MLTTRVVRSPVGELTLVGSPHGLRHVLLAVEGPPEPCFATGCDLLEEAARQLHAYFAGGLRRFDLPLDLVGTDFQLAAWRALADIPYGTTLSYGEQAGYVSLEKAAAGAPAPDFVVWNGIANQYKDHPIEVPVGETVRVFVLNAGPSIDSSFHVVGTIFEDVIKEGIHLQRGNDGNWGSQAVDLSPAQGAIVEMHFDEDGLYPIVTHAFNFVGRGALGLFQAGTGGEMPAGGH